MSYIYTSTINIYYDYVVKRYYILGKGRVIYQQYNVCDVCLCVHAYLSMYFESVLAIILMFFQSIVFIMIQIRKHWEIKKC